MYFRNSSITKTENATAIIIPQSLNARTLVDNKPPISKFVNGIEKLASWTKNNSRPKETKNAILIALLENAPSENILSYCERQFITLNNWNIMNTDRVIV